MKSLIGLPNTHCDSLVAASGVFQILEFGAL